MTAVPGDGSSVGEDVGTSVRFRMDSRIKLSTTALAAVASASVE